MKLFYKIRVLYKNYLKKIFLIPCYCKICGRDIRDFIVSDDVWALIEKNDVRELRPKQEALSALPKHKKPKELCYNCFCDECEKLGLPQTWFLVEKP